MNAHVIGVDLGTTGARSVRIDAGGRIVASSTATFPLLTPKPGWTEQEPAAWWDAVGRTLREVAGADEAPVAAIGLTGQMHGAVFLDEAGAVIRPALLWNDQRTGSAAVQLRDAVGSERLQRITGNAALTGFQAPKILWLRDAEPANYARVRSVLLPKDYLRFRLTGYFGTDPSDASGTLLFDLARREWSEEILRALDLPRDWFAPVAESPTVVARVSQEAARSTGLTAGTPVIAGAGDNAAAAVGSGVVRAGAGLVSLGTSGVVLAHASEPRVDPSGAIHAFCAAVPGGYHLMGVMLSAGGSLRWFRDTLGREGEAYAALARSAADAPPGSDGSTFLPYLAGERTPHMDPDARGAWTGLSLAHTRAHLVRSVLEGVAYGLNDGVVRMRALGVDPTEFIATGNGMSSDLWRDIIGAVFERPLRRLLVDEGPAFGAALLAAVGAGIFSRVEDAADAAVQLAAESDTPDPELVKVYRAGYARFARLYPALHAASEPARA
jgi:xylulokinase